MEEIKVGEYVRTIRGIDKIKEIKAVSVKMDGNHIYSYKLEKINNIWFGKSQITNHSFNLIDLIEVGDFVEGKQVLAIIERNNLKYLDIFGEEKVFYKEDIKSIVTKEQFESIKYEVK